MPEQVALAVRTRAGSGKGEARRLRREGRVPAVAYGAGLASTSISVDARELFHALHTDAGMNAIVRLDMDGDAHLALAREIQRHPVRRDVLHVDFVTVSRDVKVTVDIPVLLEGETAGAAEGGVADQQLHAVSVEVLPLEVPDQVVLDISDMQIGDVRRVGDLPLPDGVDLLTDPEQAVVSVSVPSMDVPEAEEVAEEPLAEGAEEALEAKGEPAEGGEEP